MYCLVESDGSAAIAEVKLLYLAQDPVGPTTKAVEGTDAGSSHVADGVEDELWLEELSVVELSVVELSIVELSVVELSVVELPIDEEPDVVEA